MNNARSIYTIFPCILDPEKITDPIHKLVMTVNDVKAVPQELQEAFFCPRVCMYMILQSEDDHLQEYLTLAEKHDRLQDIQVQYKDMLPYRQLCSCDDCFPPCIKLALAKKILLGTSWEDFTLHWNEGQYDHLCNE